MFHLISHRYFDCALIDELRSEFHRTGYVKLPAVLREPALAELARRMQRLEQRAIRRVFTMPGVGTPRRLATLGGSSIAREDPLLTSLYFHHELVGLVRGIVGQALFACQHAQEFMVANFLTQPGDSHGWHLDDPAFAVVMVLDTPAPELGGTVELIPDWLERCRRAGEAPQVNIGQAVSRARAEGAVVERQHEPGDAYVLHAAAVLHRVTPIATPGCSRAVLNLAYQAQENQVYGHTATTLYRDPVDDDLGSTEELNADSAT